jgi:hypothetical protein
MKVGSPSNGSRLRISTTVVIALMVISSPILVLNSVLLSAKSNNIDTSNQHSAFSLEDASSSPLTSSSSPSNVSPMDSDFTTQAALSSLTARPTNNIVNTNSFYDVVFLTATSGTIKTIQVTFPAGTTIPSTAFFNEAEGIGPGTASKSGQTITYTVTNAVNVPAGTKIRLEFANINNPLSPSANYKVTVTTRNAASTPIDGPTPSTAYTMKQIGANVIADNAITSSKLGTFSVTGPKLDTGSVSTSKLEEQAVTAPKIAESFMKNVAVFDTPAGHAVGWNPDGVATTFTISEPAITCDLSVCTFLSIFVVSSVNHFCNIIGADAFTQDFTISCSSAPADSSDSLHYVVENLPRTIIS